MLETGNSGERAILKPGIKPELEFQCIVSFYHLQVSSIEFQTSSDRAAYGKTGTTNGQIKQPEDSR